MSDLINRFKRLAGNSGTKEPAKTLGERVAEINTKSKERKEQLQEAVNYSSLKKVHEHVVEARKILRDLKLKSQGGMQGSLAHFANQLDEFLSTDHGEAGFEPFLKHVLDEPLKENCGMPHGEDEEVVVHDHGPCKCPQCGFMGPMADFEVPAVVPPCMAAQQEPVVPAQEPDTIVMKMEDTKVTEAENAENNTDFFYDQPKEWMKDNNLPLPEQPEKLEVPKEVINELKAALEKHKKAMQDMEDVGDHMQASFHMTVAANMQIIHDLLKTGDKMDFKKAQVQWGKLMSPIMHEFPDIVVDHLAIAPVRGKLRDMFNVIRDKEK